MNALGDLFSALVYGGIFVSCRDFSARVRFLRSRKRKMKATRRRMVRGVAIPIPRVVGVIPVVVVDVAAAAAAGEEVELDGEVAAAVGLDNVEDGFGVDVELKDALELVDIMPVTLVTATEYADRVKFFLPQSEVAPLHTKRADPSGTPADFIYGFWHQEMIWKLLRLGDPDGI